MVPSVHLIPTLALIGQVHAVPVNPYSTTINTSSLSEVSPHASNCNDINNCRILSGIIYSCLLTIFACTWISYHPDVPDCTHTLWRIRATRFFTVVFSFLVPELTIAKAASQCWKVWKYKSPFQGWTRAHTYFTIMGGFIDSTQPDSALSVWEMQRLTADSYPEIVETGGARTIAPKEDAILPESTTPSVTENPPPQPWIRVTESEILDKSKDDALGKFVTVLQATWFIVQYLSRWAAHQPRTQLEVMTFAYAGINVVIYILWLDKPFDIREPIDVRGRAIRIDAPQKAALRGAWFSVIGGAADSLANGVKPAVGMTVLPTVGILFGGVHCFAWWFPFPTKREAVLWKICTVYCTVCPIAMPLIVLLFTVGFAPLLKYLHFLSEDAYEDVNDMLAGTGGILFVTGYIVCRIILLVLSFTSLRAQPAGIYEAVNWTSFFPHVG